MMPRIDAHDVVCTVIVTVDAPAEVMADLEEHARVGLDEFHSCESYIAGAVHLSADGTRMVQYSQWTSEEGYTGCRDDPRWDDLPSTGRFMAHVVSGRAEVDARTYTVVESSRR